MSETIELSTFWSHWINCSGFHRNVLLFHRVKFMKKATISDTFIMWPHNYIQRQVLLLQLLKRLPKTLLHKNIIYSMSSQFWWLYKKFYHKTEQWSFTLHFSYERMEPIWFDPSVWIYRPDLDDKKYALRQDISKSTGIIIKHNLFRFFGAGSTFYSQSLYKKGTYSYLYTIYGLSHSLAFWGKN